MRSRAFHILAVLVIISGILLMTGWFVARSTQFQIAGQITAKIDTTEKVVALTFDDGPVPEPSRVLMEVLASQRTAATFFLVGSAMQRHPETTRALVNAGHEIGNHSWSHQRMVFKSKGLVEQEIDDTNQEIRAAGYTGPIHFRPPYGKKLFVLPLVLDKREIRTITWDVSLDGNIPPGASPEEIASYVVSRVEPGSIVLMHVMFQSRANELAAVPIIIRLLKERGYRFVTVSELLALERQD